MNSLSLTTQKHFFDVIFPSRRFVNLSRPDGSWRVARAQVVTARRCIVISVSALPWCFRISPIFYLVFCLNLFLASAFCIFFCCTTVLLVFVKHSEAYLTADSVPISHTNVFV